MPRKVLNDLRLSDIAVAIRGKTGSEDSIKVGEMADIIEQDIDTKYEKYSGTINYSSTLLTRVTEDDLQGLTSLGDQGFRCCKSLESCDLPDTVTYIGRGSLNQTALKNMIHMGKPTVIEQCAFENNSKLLNVVIPETVTRIGQLAFKNCTSLTEVDCRATTPPELGGNVFVNCPKLKYIFVPADSVEAYKTDLNWMQYSNIIYGSKLKYIISGEITALTADDMADVTTIYSDWASDSALSYIEFPNTITDIGTYTFYNCDSLSKIIIPDSVLTIGSENSGATFTNCDNLSLVVLGSGVDTIYNKSFHRTNTAVDMTVICKATTPPALGGDGVFPPVSTGIVKAIYVPRQSVDAYKADSRWANYADVIKPITYKQYYNTTGIPGAKWDEKTNLYFNKTLTEITFADLEGITNIHAYAYTNNYSLTTIQIPDTVTTIGNYAFRWSRALTSVECRATTPPTVGTSIFFGCSNLKYIYVPAESVDAYKVASGWSAYADIIYGTKFALIVNGDNTCLTADDFYGCTTAMQYIYGSRQFVSIELPNTIQGIGAWTFSGNNNLKQIIIPDNVLRIGENEMNAGGAFTSCYNLAKVVLGTGILSMATLSFYRSTGVKMTVICKATTPPTITSDVFPSISSGLVEHIYVPATSVDAYKAASGWSDYTDVIEAITDAMYVDTTGRTPVDNGDTLMHQYNGRTLGDITADMLPGVTKIGRNSFWACTSITSVELPDTITSLGHESFQSARNLKTLTCHATTPPTWDDTTIFTGVTLEHIYVPSASVDTYKAASGWSTYADIIEAITEEV